MGIPLPFETRVEHGLMQAIQLLSELQEDIHEMCEESRLHRLINSSKNEDTVTCILSASNPSQDEKADFLDG